MPDTSQPVSEHKPSNMPDDAHQAAQMVAALKHRREGLTFRGIAEAMGCSASTAYRLVKQGLAEYIGEPAAELRQLESERLDDLISRAYKVLMADHIVVQHGKIVRDEDGNPIRDHGPTLAAINTLKSLSAELRKLHGLDMPTRTDVTVHQVDPEDLAIAEFLREADAKNAVLLAELRGEPTA